MDVDSYIDSIARALAQRSGRGSGRATAMIGAGFSLNAQKLTESVRSFPLWRDIVRPLIDELLPQCPECAGNCVVERIAGGRDVCLRRYNMFTDAAGASGMMALGDKFEAKKGSARLRAALESAVPDRDYGPGRAHQLLVRLPWADILTTNWDTLLEQAVDAYDRSYDKVITVKQIASAFAPRIVKLHGCARSGTDLIFTEESFRTYPKKYAPFVSLVQQSLMENVVVLFGFSGADPNFRAWHGWVRDHLGTDLQPIYMVSLRPTEPIDINLMAGRLITQINLSEKWPHLEDRLKIETFLEEIQKRLRSLKVNLDWPSTYPVPNSDASPKNLTANVHSWKQRLNSYPGWLVAPARNRADLVSHLDEALNVAFSNSFTDRNPGLAPLVGKNTHRPDANNAKQFLTDREQTALLVVEALRIALARPGEQLLGILQEILAQALVDLFGIQCDPAKASGATDPRESSDPQKSPNKASESSRLFGLLNDGIMRLLKTEPANERQSRAETDPDSESAYATVILKAPVNEYLKGEHRALVRDVVVRLLPLIELIEREARLRNEDASARRLRDVLWLVGENNVVRETAVRGALLAALERFDLQEIQSLLLLWPGQQHDASSNLRHAAVQREIGKIRDSYTAIVAIVTRLRSLGNERRRGVAESSRESWAFYLYADLLERNMPDIEAILAPQPDKLKAIDVYEELRERLDELEVNRCDPRREMDRLARDIEAATEHTRLERMVAKLASIQADASGRETVQTDGADRHQHVLDDPANSFLIISETIGVAIHHVSRGDPLALIAARLLAATNRRLAINLLLRAGTPEDLPFAHTILGDDRLRTDQGDWLVAEVVFDRQNCLVDFDMLSEMLERLAAPSPTLSSDFVESSYLGKKFRLLQHLLGGLIQREQEPLANELAEKGFALACKIAYSPVVSATHAGWSYSLALFEAALMRFPFQDRAAHEILTKLLDLPIPTESNDSGTASWPDPIRMLSAAWYPRAESTGEPDTTLPIETDLSGLGKKITKSVKQEMGDKKTLMSVLYDHERRWKAMTEESGPMRRLIIARRIALISSVLPEATENAPDSTELSVERNPS